MRARYALMLAILVTIIFAGNYLFFSSFQNEREKVIITRVLDGDTVKIDDGRTVRLLNINTPEKGTFGAAKAAEFLTNYINKTVELDSEGTEKYGRTLGRIYYEDKYLNWEIVRNGLGHNFLTNSAELESFNRAQESAIEEESGIWKHSPFYGCIKMKINIKDEFVDLDIVCNVSIEGWTLSDESTKFYKFGKNKAERIRLYSGSGKDTDSEKYWNEGNVWNNDKDSAIIRDKEGFLVDFYSYSN